LQSVLSFADENGIVFLGAFNANGVFNDLGHSPSTLGKAFDAFLKTAPEALALFRDKLTFSRTSGDNTYATPLGGALTADTRQLGEQSLSGPLRYLSSRYYKATLRHPNFS
jgi:hypothetical protein